MSKFEWMELETISNEIAHAQSRLDASRGTKNLGLVQLLESEIADAAKRRAQILSDITKGLGIGRFARPKPQLVTTEVNQPEEAPVEQEPVEQVAPPPPTAATKMSGTASDANSKEGETSMWDKVTVDDLERVKRGLANRRSEMLARHAEELKSLEAEQSEIDAFERAIAAFTQKFKLAPTAEVVLFDGERVPVQAG